MKDLMILEGDEREELVDALEDEEEYNAYVEAECADSYDPDRVHERHLETFKTEEDCWSVLLNNNTLYEQINAVEGYCDVSEVASKIVKPKIRPW